MRTPAVSAAGEISSALFSQSCSSRNYHRTAAPIAVAYDHAHVAGRADVPRASTLASGQLRIGDVATEVPADDAIVLDRQGRCAAACQP